jgi:hypothetical protein
MTTKVKVQADDLGNVIIPTSNPEIGYIKLEQKCNIINGNWVKNQKKTCLIFGKFDELKDFNFTKDQELDGQIIIEESFIPFNENNAEKEMKMAGNSGIPCLLDGQPIYRRTRYTTNMNEQDLLIQHNNTVQIKEAIDANKELNLILE